VSKLSQLQKAYELAREQVGKVESQANTYRYSRREDIEREVNERFGAKLEEARRLRNAADTALEDEQDHLAREAKDTPFPIGTKLVEWEHPPFGRHEWQKAGRAGVFEVITRDSQHSAGLRWQRAELGAFVIRIIKKDETPSRNYIAFRDGFRFRWLPEGKSPKGEIGVRW
jgi:hypothetical protein